MNCKQALVDTWRKLVAFYPQQCAAYGDIGGAVFQEWERELVKFEPAVIQAATVAVLHDGANEFPPNLPKFERHCEAERDRIERTRDRPGAPWQVPHESVVRIEMAKQRALCGELAQCAPKPARMIRNWTREDQGALERLVRQWTEDTGLDGLNELLDDYPFSSGTHREILERAARGQHESLQLA